MILTFAAVSTASTVWLVRLYYYVVRSVVQNDAPVSSATVRIIVSITTITAIATSKPTSNPYKL